jgi:hypothetical protein
MGRRGPGTFNYASEPMWQMSPTETTIFLSSLVPLLAILLLA